MTPTVTQSLQEYGRGICGGLIFSLPLLYTMEMWWAGIELHPLRQLALLAFTFMLLLGYNRFAGLRKDESWLEVVIDSVEELGIGLALSAVCLTVLGRVELSDPLREMLGKIVVEAAMIAIGVSVGTAQLGAAGDENEEGMGDCHSPGFLGQLMLAGCGAVLLAASVAPTEEIQLLAYEASPIHLFGVIVCSLGVVGTILYLSEFRGAERHVRLGTWTGIFATYCVALVAGVGCLWVFGKLDGLELCAVLNQAVILGFPASLGASAGRLLVQAA